MSSKQLHATTDTRDLQIFIDTRAYMMYRGPPLCRLFLHVYISPLGTWLSGVEDVVLSYPPFLEHTPIHLYLSNT